MKKLVRINQDVKAHLVHGLSGVHVLSPVDMVDTKYVQGSVLVNIVVFV